MSLDYATLRAALEGEPLPTALVDLDAVERNAARLRRQLAGSGKTLRVATKSVRHVGLLRRILAAGEGVFRGLMCFTAAEAAFLLEEGFDDLLVAYPSVRGAGLVAVARAVAEGATVRLMADEATHLEAYAAAARRAGTELEVVLELDVAYRPTPRVHLGVLRSPLREPADLARVAARARGVEGVRVVGLMGYEAHVAGLPDASPFGRALNPARKALKRLSIPRVAELRGAAVRALSDAGVELRLVNGGGTGSLRSTAREPWVSEVTAGSGFVCSHLFDYYEGTTLEPAAYFALEVSRRPRPGIVTCLGGGYVASGEPGWDRLPLPWLPRGMAYVAVEGAGEVQTPLKVGGPAAALEVGDPVIFRHAKAGELAERFDDYLMVRGGAPEAREPTYRGMGRGFL